MKIAIIGIGGRTGTMFAFELQKAGDILGIGRKRDISIIKEKRLYLERGERPPILFEGKVIKDFEFPKNSLPDIIFFAVKNPVGPVIKYYYQKIKDNEKLPSLVLSQNGIVAAKEAIEALKEVLGKRFEDLRIIRISLFNSVDSQEVNGKIYIDYFLPIRLAFGIYSGPKETKDVREIFEKAGMETEEVPTEEIENMELSKLFTNLVGMASAAKNLSPKEGFEDKETFEEEITALKEYIRVVQKKGNRFLNFRHYPIKSFATLINLLPLSVLSPFRKKIAKIITKGRGEKLKGNLDEVDYYNGEIVKLGKELGIETPVNQKICQKIKNL